MLEEQRVLPVGLALEAGLLLHGVVGAVPRRAGVRQLTDIIHEYERLENGPVRRRGGSGGVIL